ncbi:MAG: TonB-dependent receptor [Acidobacteria bacterium]|nr:TonB-dependent receptor [Acidobacteriota bacterium]MCA1610566.1 TonB-dependent receptor [Acidobacteriota bacterium]
MRRISVGCLVIGIAGLLASPTVVPAQGLTNAGLRGRVMVQDQGIPGVLVELTSPSLQGTRTAYTKSNGDYVFVGMPPGDYTVNFTLSGMQTVTKKVALTAAREVTLDATMVVAGVTATETVTAKTETVSTGLQGSTTITRELTDKLPVARTIVSAVAASSGVAQVTTLGNAFSISGGQTFDNLFTVDGAVIIDNVRSTPNNLFIEDAIQETTTSVNAVSSEFGRFSGGVVNTITKSGGNLFSGSFRTTLTNDAWSAVSPAKETRVQKVNPRYEATLGGFLWKDHVWFFGSGRYQDTSVASQTSAPPGVAKIPFQIGDTDKRYQGKLTVSPVANHTLTGSILQVDQTQSNNSFGTILDTDSLVNRTLPQKIITANYNGVITSNFFVEGLYSQRKFTFENSGSQYTDLIKGTLLRDLNFGRARYNSPTFCGVCGPEKRNNEDYLIKGTYFLSTPSLGSHTILAGYDHFAGSRIANNHQSGSDYRIFTTDAIFRNGDIFPVIGPTSYVYYTPIFTLTKGTNALTHSGFLNDSWRVNDRLSVNLGVRYDKNKGANSLGVVTANDSAWSPRLAAAYSLTKNGAVKVGASYAHYVGAIQDTILDSSSAGGQPGTFIWYITGAGAPVINNPAGPTLTTRADAIKQVFDFFFAQGCPDISTCRLPLAYANFPGLSNKITTTLKSPYAREYTAGINGTVGTGSYRMDFVRRDFHDFYNTVLNISTGQARDPAGNKYDVGVVGNTNDLVRNYTGLQTQFQYRLFNNRLNVGGAWTWSHTLGNFDGEAGNSGPVTGGFQAYPEYKDPSFNLPTGDLATDVRHRVRLFATVDLPFIPRRIGVVSFSATQAYDTGSPYGAVGTVRSRSYVTNPGYSTPPSSVTYYFTARDAFRTDDIKRTDIAINFSTKIAGVVEIFIQPQVYNLFNNRGVIGVDKTVNTARNPGGGTYQNFNPFTDKPVQRPHLDNTVKTANYDLGPNFGKPTSVNDYQIPRQFQITAGIRF